MLLIIRMSRDLNWEILEAFIISTSQTAMSLRVLMIQRNIWKQEELWILLESVLMSRFFFIVLLTCLNENVYSITTFLIVSVFLSFILGRNLPCCRRYSSSRQY